MKRTFYAANFSAALGDRIMNKYHDKLHERRKMSCRVILFFMGILTATINTTETMAKEKSGCDLSDRSTRQRCKDMINGSYNDGIKICKEIKTPLENAVCKLAVSNNRTAGHKACNGLPAN
jgi:hypothetical protein